MRTENDPGCLPSIEDLRPATPSRTPGSGLHETRGLAAAFPAPDAFAPPWVLLGSLESWAAVHVIPLPAGIALLSASVVARRLLQPLRRTGTPFELPILAREWSFRPAARRHQPMPVALASPVRCHTGGLRTAIRSRRLSLRRAPLARTRRIVGRGARAKAWFARSWTMSRVPSSWRSGHPGHRFDWLRGLEDLDAHRPGRDPPRMPPREGRHRRKNQGAFRRDGTLTRPGHCSLVRAWTAAPSRRLRGGIARGTRAPFSPLLRRPPSDEVSIRCGSTG